MTRFAAGVVGLILLATAPANSPDPSSLTVSPDQVDRAKQLVRQLGSEAYRDRDRAARELRGMGRLAVTVLAGAVEAEIDPEVRSRCEDLLPAAEADDMAARVAAFLADADGKFDHDVPGWAEFRAAVGDDPPARALFAAVVKNPDNHPLLRATRRPADKLPGALVTRRRQIQYTMNTSRRALVMVNGEIVPGFSPEPSDIAALLLAESLTPDRGVPSFRPGMTEYQVTVFLYSDKGKKVTAADAAFRRLVVHWLETRSGPAGVGGALLLAWQLGLDSAAVNKLAVRVLATDGMPAVRKMEAFNILVKNEAKDQLPAVLGLFADDTLLDKGVPDTASPDDLRLRDAALNVAVRLTGQTPAEYGFAYGPSSILTPMFVPALPVNRAMPTGDGLYTQRFRPSGGATADQKRDVAFKKWDEWAAKNAKP